LSTRNVVVYERPNCMPCKGTKRQLDKLGIPYDTVDTSVAGTEVVDMLKELGHLESPVVIVRNEFAEIVEHWSGHRIDNIRRLLA